MKEHSPEVAALDACKCLAAQVKLKRRQLTGKATKDSQDEDLNLQQMHNMAEKRN